MTDKQLRHVRKALSGETLNTVGYFTADEMQPRVDNEIQLFNETNPPCTDRLVSECNDLSLKLLACPL